ncbi:recombinase zinc beta ribbon domain-containing protein [Mesorhizobium sp. M1409]|uniref:recombinase zinc beta ribbon domain-containing protein n=1 Tax=unclassified Mesorhizobium TaxID=325217 RepID=UPI003339C2D9
MHSLRRTASASANACPARTGCCRTLTVCRRCGYAYYGKRAPSSRKYDPTNTLRYYRCIAADGYRFSGHAVCNNPAVRGDHLEEAVWDQVKGLLEDSRRVADEYRRRLRQARDEIREPDEIVRLERQMATLRRGIGRLIDSYAEGVIDKAEFEPRIAGLKQRLSQLQERHRAAVEVAENERDLSLLISRLEDFSAKVTAGLAGLDRAGMRQIIRSVVRRGRNRRRPHRDHLPGSPARWPSPPKITKQNDQFHATLYRRSSSGPSAG